MANKTIDELTAASLPLDLTELMHIVQGGNSRKTSVGGLLGEIKWLSKPIGEPFPLWDHLDGCDIPPIDSPNFRFIVLTAGKSGAGEYNAGILTSESVTGSAPLVIATAVIDDAGSPLNGELIHLINTERRVLRAGSAGVVENDQMQKITGALAQNSQAGTGVFGEPSGAFGISAPATHAQGSAGGTLGRGLTFDSANSPGARAGNETRPKNIGATYFMRIR